MSKRCLMRAAWLIAIALICCSNQVRQRPLFAQERHQANRSFAATPPLGWNSWDSYGLRIDEKQFRDNVEALAKKLKPFGYSYAVIDEGWYMQNPELRSHPEQLKYELDKYGRFVPTPSRFASAMRSGENDGFKTLAKWVHAQGLQFGIHIIRGIPRESVLRNTPIEGSSFKAQDAADQGDPCSWDPTSWGIRDNAAGQAWYDALLRQYAAWGVDFLKVDCVADHPYKASEIRQLRLAIQHSGRNILLSLSPGPTQLAHQAEVAELSQMWRISNDIWDVWDSVSFPIGVKQQFRNAAQWAKFARPGNWPDADMLPVGELRPYPDVGPGPRHTRLTPDEQRTQLSLWCMARSPLIIGANLTLLDEDTLRLLTNRDLLHINQAATASSQLFEQGDLIAWTADLPKKQHAIAIFNVGDTVISVDRPWSDFGINELPRTIRNAWEGKSVLPVSRLKSELKPHASLVLIVE